MANDGPIKNEQLAILKIAVLTPCGPLSLDGLESLGYSDVGDFMIMTDLRCWWQNHDVAEFFYVGDF